MNVVEDFSVGLETTGGEHFTLDHRFDFMRTYPGLNHAILNVVVENGINRLHMSREVGLMVAKRSLIVCQDMDYIGRAEYEKYLQVQEGDLENWIQ